MATIDPILKRLTSSSEEEPKFDMGLSAWLDRVLRTQYASANVAEKLIQGDLEGIPEALWSGLTGQEKGSYRKVAEDLGLPAPAWWGFAGDVALDPLTYIPIGAMAKTVTKPITEIPAVKAGLTALRESGPVQTVGRALDVNFRPKGWSVEEWTKYRSAQVAGENERKYTLRELNKFVDETHKVLKPLYKKKVVNEDDLTAILGNAERGKGVYPVPKEAEPVVGQVRKFMDEITASRKERGLGSITDDEYAYVLRMTAEKAKESGYGLGRREFSTKTASDISRKYYKFMKLGNETSHTIAKPSEMKLVPMSVKGVSKESLGNIFESTVRDISDLQDLGNNYGIKVIFRNSHSGRKGSVGHFDPYRREFVVHTKGWSQKYYLETAAHELAHVVHGEIGSFSSLFQMGRRGGKYGKLADKYKFWQTIEKGIVQNTAKAEKKIIQYFGYSKDFLKKNKEYLHKPTELYSRFVEILKNDQSAAKAISPELYEITKNMMGMVDNGKIDRRAWEIFTRPTNRVGNYSPDQIWKNPKTGELFVGKQADQYEMEAARKAREISIAKGAGIQPLPEFSKDIPAIMHTAARREAASRAGTVFYSKVQELGSIKKGPGLAESTIPELKGLYFPEHILKEIEKTVRTFTTEETTGKFLSLFDSVQSTWKKWTLGIFPAYHFRNFLGNTWNNYLAGVTDPNDYIRAASIIRRSVGKGKLTAEESKLLLEAEKHGVLGKGFYSAENLKILSKDRATEVVENINKIAEKGMEFGTHVEDWARLTHFMNMVKKGKSYEEAAMSVKKYLFDYSELTDFEKQVLRRLMPFYAWTRKNVPLQIESFINKTGKMTPVLKAQQSLQESYGSPDETLMPDYVKERMPIIVGKKGQDVSYFPLEGFLPMADLMKLSRSQDIVGELLTPILRTPIELASNRSWYFQQPIEKYPGETKEFLQIDVPSRVSYVLRQVRILNEIDRMVGYAQKSSEQPPEATIPQKFTRLFTGIKAQRYNIEKAKKFKILDLKKDIEALKIGYRRAERYGRIPEQARIMEKIEDMEKSIKKLEQ